MEQYWEVGIAFIILLSGPKEKKKKVQGCIKLANIYNHLTSNDDKLDSKWNTVMNFVSYITVLNHMFKNVQKSLILNSLSAGM